MQLICIEAVKNSVMERSQQAGRRELTLAWRGVRSPRPPGRCKLKEQSGYFI
jgi:hypothetical protein